MYNYGYFHDGRLPQRMEFGTRMWIEEGMIPGDFLQAIISHDLFKAVNYADGENIAALRDWVLFFHNEAPIGCHGKDALKEWKGLKDVDPREFKRIRSGEYGDPIHHSIKVVNVEGRNMG